MPRPRNPWGNPVRVETFRRTDGTPYWRIRYYPTGRTDDHASRVYLPGSWGTRDEAEAIAAELRRELAALAAGRDPGAFPHEQPCELVIDAYLHDLDARLDVPKGTRRAWGVAVRQGLQRGPLAEKLAALPIRELPAHAAELLTALDSAPSKRSGLPRIENTRGSYRTGLSHFGEWCVKRGFLVANPFEADPAAAKERRAAAKKVRRATAEARAKQATVRHADGDSDRGLGIRDVPSPATCTALQRAMVRQLVRSNVTTKSSGKGSRGGLPPFDRDSAEQLSMSVLVRSFAGLRTCEALALHSSRVTADGLEIFVDRQWDRYKAFGPTDDPTEFMVPPKYDKERRTIVWPNFAPTLRRLVDWANEHTDGWLFARPHCRQQTKWWVTAYEEVLEKTTALMAVEHAAGIGDPVLRAAVPTWAWKLHFLRHTFGSYSLTAVPNGGLGWSLKLTSECLGHASTRTTAAVYAHVVQTERERVRERLISIPGLAAPSPRRGHGE